MLQLHLTAAPVRCICARVTMERIPGVSQSQSLAPVCGETIRRRIGDVVVEFHVNVAWINRDWGSGDQRDRIVRCLVTGRLNERNIGSVLCYGRRLGCQLG